MSTRPTVKDVAKLANVSIATVSHVINGTRYVSPEVTEKVQTAMREINYIYNNAARSLRSNKTNTIGIIIPNIANPFFANTVNSIETVLNQNGYKILLCHSSDNQEKEMEQLESFGDGRVDGVILSPASPRLDYSQLPIFQKVPFVFFDRRPHMSQYCGAFINMYDATKYAVEQLVLAGHTKIGLIIGIARFSTTSDRRRGYEDALQKNGISILENLILTCPTTEQNGYERMRHLIQNTDCTAVFVANNLLSLGAMRYLREAKVEVPKRISVIGLASKDWVGVTQPPLTTIHEPLEDLGTTTAELMLQRLNGEDIQNKQITLPAFLSERTSY